MVFFYLFFFLLFKNTNKYLYWAYFTWIHPNEILCVKMPLEVFPRGKIDQNFSGFNQNIKYDKQKTELPWTPHPHCDTCGGGSIILRWWLSSLGTGKLVRVNRRMGKAIFKKILVKKWSRLKSVVKNNNARHEVIAAMVDASTHALFYQFNLFSHLSLI